MRRATSIDDLEPSSTRISIHALLAESDNDAKRQTYHLNEFLSTLSLRRATAEMPGKGKGKTNFYPRSPCGERLKAAEFRAKAREISIHALLAESDRIRRDGTRTYEISIHALLAESDLPCLSSWDRLTNFYPRSPCGERRGHRGVRGGRRKFLSTLSLRRATAKVHKTVGHFCAYETNFMGIASSC